MRIDSLGEDDWERARAIRLAALADSPRAFGSRHDDVVGWPEAAWREQLRTLDTFIAVADGADAGMVRTVRHAEDPDGVYLISMWVNPAFRRRGVGSALVDRAVLWTREAGRARLFLDVRTYNLEALALYLHEGFVATGESETVGDSVEDQYVLDVRTRIS